MSNGIFLSYSHADSRLVSSLAERLRQEGRSVWVDTKVAPGAEWMPEIDRAISSAQVFVVIISRAFLSSAYCHAELGSIVAKSLEDPSSRILVVHNDDVKPEEIPSVLSRYPRIRMPGPFEDIGGLLTKLG
jgi:hypothetical protein